MICKKCGNILPDNAKICSACGASTQEPSGERQTYTTYQTQRSDRTLDRKVPPVGFVEAVKRFAAHYADFSGRSRRSEYWWVVLFNLLMDALFAAFVPQLSYLWTLVTLIPSIAICVRRLHDVGKSGWWYLFIFLPLVGFVIVLIQLCRDSAEDNQWGPNPKR